MSACLIHGTQVLSCVDCQQATSRVRTLSFSSGFAHPWPGYQLPCPGSRGRRERAVDLLSAAQLSGTAQLDAWAHCLSSLFTSYPSTPLFHPVRFLAPTPAPSPPPGWARFPRTKVFFLALMDILARQPLSHTGWNPNPHFSRANMECRRLGLLPTHHPWCCAVSHGGL